MKLKLTKKIIDNLDSPTERTDYLDTQVKGLVLRISPTGSKVFYFLKRLDGKLERVKLGGYPSISLDQAKDKIKLLNAAILLGNNPAEAKRAIKAEPTFGDLLKQYVTDKRSRSGKPLAQRTQRDYLKLLDTHLAPIAKLKISKVTKDQVRKLKIASDAQANRSRAVIGAVFTWAEAEDLISATNPAKALKTRLVKSRERFLLPNEMEPFFQAIEASPMRDFFLMALLTGQRRANVEKMKWADLNLVEGTWQIDGSETKNGDSQIVPLTQEAVTILKTRRTTKIVNATWVFPGRRSRVTGEIGPMAEPKVAWKKVLDAAGIKNLRLHDLRRTLGSWQARQGTSLQVIGKSLGHRSQAATAIYSRLDLDPVRESVQGATTAMLKAGRKKVK